MISLTSDVIPGQNKPLEKPNELGLIRAWSYSALKVFEECRYRSYIQKVKYIPEPSGPAAERGSVIHQEAEDFVAGKLDSFPTSLKKFESEFEVFTCSHFLFFNFDIVLSLISSLEESVFPLENLE